MFDSGLDSEHVFGHAGSMDRTRRQERRRRTIIRRRRVAVVAVAASLTLGLPAIARAMSGTGSGEASSTYVVQAGDTLWSIAVRQAPGRDPRIVVDAIARANRVDAGGLVPGQQLLLPDA
jgi:nucleoid-associated protein YgaU